MTNYQRAQLRAIRLRHAALKKRSSNLPAADSIIFGTSVGIVLWAVIGLLAGWL